ncbi:MAG TPA: alpha/beta hydrolase [Trebonia sp.]|jgi:pimeloyl-ACP methyl ester carboxylesterase|nr:alpha/beta hydrolase [Trebonia sp.]
MSKWKIPVAMTGGALALTAAFATAAAAQTGPAHAVAGTQASTARTTAGTHATKPTIVLVAGAFEDSSAWDGEITLLEHAGYPVIAPAVPLRGVASDAAYLTALVRSINGPVVLVGHSYGGELITEIAAQDPTQVKALVYAAAFIPKAGETANQLITQFPGSLLGPDTTYTVNIPGGVDTYVKPADFRALFAGDRTPAQAAVSAAEQRPIASSALSEPAAAGVPAGIPVYAIVASQDMAIPPAAERFEAERAHATITTVDSAHDVDTSHPGAVTAVIERAAR